jgi:hypothetical protein
LTEYLALFVCQSGTVHSEWYQLSLDFALRLFIPRMSASDTALGNGDGSSSSFTVTPFYVRPKTRNETGNSGCNRNEVVGTGIKGTCFVQLTFHAS